MRSKMMVWVLILVMMVGNCACAEMLEKEQLSEKEILFRNIPWGTSFSEIETQNPVWGLYSYGGDFYDVKSVSNILTFSGYTKQYEFTDIRIYGDAENGAVNVAGFTTTDIRLFFARLPVEGILSKEEKDTALYGARYEFENMDNIDAMEAELIRKLTQLYGVEGTVSVMDGWSGTSEKYVYWYGANQTAVCLKTVRAKNADEDSLYISYAWLRGDELLQNANDAEVARINAENEAVVRLIEENQNNFDGL